MMIFVLQTPAICVYNSISVRLANSISYPIMTKMIFTKADMKCLGYVYFLAAGDKNSTHPLVITSEI